MESFKKIKSISSWVVFAIALVVYYLSAERTGSLWDCGEFILGAYKLEVVHPPGAPLFMIIGRFFTWFATLVSDDPANIAFAINLMSGICTAFTAFFAARITMMFGKKLLVGRAGTTTKDQNIALALAGLAGGLSTAFCSSIWFSAVEGEVYAMSTMFTALTFWAATKWFVLPNESDNDRWLVLVAYLAGLSIGVHLLSLLTFPAIGLMYYYKKYKKATFVGTMLALIAGFGAIVFIQKIVIVGIPSLWKSLELMAVNGMGLPFHSGLAIALILIAIAAYFVLRYSHQKGFKMLNLLAVSAIMVMIGFSTIGVIVIRANADTPINMNVPSDALRLLPYLNREQYGERPMLYGPHFDAKPADLAREDRYGRVGDEYVVVDEKLDYVYDNKDKILFPRIGHTDGPRPELHRNWYQALNGEKFKGKPGMGYNIQFMLNYQFGWMYWRYFMWNFAGKQNASQGYYAWDKSDGNWLSGIKFLDEWRLHNYDEITDTMKAHKGYNKYYMLPFIFGLIGMFFMLRRNRKDFFILAMLFFLTGLGIILYSNQPPNEPRERDYVLVGSFFAFSIWIGLAVLAIFNMIKERAKLAGPTPAIIAGALVLIAPFLMGTQNFDDHSRRSNYGSRDYAANFLNSVDKDAIIFTYGDNDTYPLWYAQEVENIRRDVRVVNLSLIAVDWYIEKLRNKVNDSAPIKLTLDTEAYRGKNRNQVFFFNPQDRDNLSTPANIYNELSFIGNPANNTQGQTIMRTRKLVMPLDLNKMRANNLISKVDSNTIDNIVFNLPSRGYIGKDELAVIDLIASNINDRAIYFAVTCKNEKLLNLNDYMQMEGLALRLIPEKNKSIRGLSIYGSGKVDTDKAYNNIMNKWAWGNFDKVETFIDESYAAELQAMRIVMMRTSQDLLLAGDKKRAADVAKKFFEGFPHFNFPYQEDITPFLEILIDAGEEKEAIKHTRILANELAQRLTFYDSLDDDDFESSFKSDFTYAIKGVGDILEYEDKISDKAFVKEMKDLLGGYDIRNLRN